MVSLLAAYLVAAILVSAYALGLLISTGRLRRRLREMRSVADAGTNDLPSERVA
jgi:hypothetical protein